MFRDISYVQRCVAVVVKSRPEILEILAVLQLLLSFKKFTSVLHYLRKNCNTLKVVNSFALRFRVNSHRASLDLQMPFVGMLKRRVSTRRYRNSSQRDAIIPSNCWSGDIKYGRVRVFVNRAKLQSFETISVVTVKPYVGERARSDVKSFDIPTRCIAVPA